MHKNIQVLIDPSHRSSEAVKERIIKCAGVPKSAVQITRDANGRVVTVVINLPTAIANIIIALLNRIPGVSAVLVTDIIPGTVGLDGTQASLTNMASQGWSVTYPNAPTITYNADKTMTFTSPTGAVGYMYMTKDGASPVSPLPFTLEVKMKSDAWDYLNSTSNGGFDLRFRNDVVDADFVCQQKNGSNNLAMWVFDNLGTANSWVFDYDSNYHIYKWAVDSDGLVTVSRDGTTLGTMQLGTSTGTGNNIFISVSVAPNSPWTLDYARFTQA